MLRIWSFFVDSNLSTIGLVNPLRNAVYYQNIFIQAHNHFISFVLIGGGSAYLFLKFLNRQALIEKGEPVPETKLYQKLHLLTKWKK